MQKDNLGSHILRITGNAELPEALKLDHSYSGEFKATCVKIEKGTNNDGTADYTYKLKLELASIDSDNGIDMDMVTKDKKSQSKLLHDQFYYLGAEKGLIGREEMENFYQTSMVDIRRFLPQILTWIDGFKRTEEGSYKELGL